ncbi:MAG TPA: hypothetical protein VE643_07690 [Nitrososphaeraceae archaeon]|nr:hypothetical protein [Nitrososphaeraceae archaeon]
MKSNTAIMAGAKNSSLPSNTTLRQVIDGYPMMDKRILVVKNYPSIVDCQTTSRSLS